MATPNQIAANLANSKKSTGPKTDAGKAKSALNRLSHGFTAATANLIPGEDPEEFKALLADLTAEHQPATPTEQILVERMAQSQWLILRSFRLQTISLNGLFSITITKELGLLIRYQSAADRAFHKAHAELLKAQKERKKSEIGFESQTPAAPEPKAPPIARITPDFSPEPAPETPNADPVPLKQAA